MDFPTGPLSYQDLIAKLYYHPEKRPLNIIQCPSVTFQVTDDCNLRCSYCYQINKGHHKMPFSVAKEFINLLFENSEQTQQYIDTSQCDGITLEFIGGEPFLEVELIDQIIEYFQKAAILYNHIWARNWQISISTNGTLYFNPEVQKFIKKYFHKLSLSITVDGNKQLHDACRKFPNGEGSYDLASVAAYDFMYNLHGNLGSKITLSPDNIQYLSDAIKDFIIFGYKNIFANCVFEDVWKIGHATILYNELKKIADYLLENNLEQKIFFSLFKEKNFCPLPEDDTSNWCGGNAQMLALDYQGYIYPCVRYMASSLGNNVKPIIVGNVKKGFMSTEEEKRCINCLKIVNRISQSTKKCIECPVAKGCAWCQAYNYQCGHGFDYRATGICNMHKATALANAYYWNKCYQKNNLNKQMYLYLEKKEAIKIISEEEYKKIKKMELL